MRIRENVLFSVGLAPVSTWSEGQGVAWKDWKGQARAERTELLGEGNRG